MCVFVCIFVSVCNLFLLFAIYLTLYLFLGCLSLFCFLPCRRLIFIFLSQISSGTSRAPLQRVDPESDRLLMLLLPTVVTSYTHQVYTSTVWSLACFYNSTHRAKSSLCPGWQVLIGSPALYNVWSCLVNQTTRQRGWPNWNWDNKVGSKWSAAF